MEYLFDVWEGFRKLIDGRSSVLLLLDYDGTITPIVERPGLAVLPSKTRNLLVDLSKSSRITLGIVSGRPLSELKKRVGVDGIYYVGNHGLECKGPGMEYLNLTAVKTKLVLDEVYLKLVHKLKHITGVLVEHKEITLAVHYRMASAHDAPKVRSIFTRIVRPYTENGDVKIAENKKTLDVMPPVDWDKGRMILQLLDMLSRSTNKDFLPLYIGDDATDEDAFKALAEIGICILVSDSIKKSYAKYYVKSVAEVMKILELLVDHGHDNKRV